MTTFLAADVGKIISSVLLAVLILLAMICVHEAGHFIAGRILKFKINEFAVGFGPALLKHKSKKHGTVFSVRCFPLGGFCSFEGENAEGGEYSFNSQKPWKRIIVLISGALCNYLLALLLVMLSYAAFGQACYKIDGVIEEGYSSAYSLQADDIILSVEGRSVYFATDMVTALNGKKEGETAEVTVLRGGERRSVEVAMRADCNCKNSTQAAKVWRALGADVYEGQDGNSYFAVSSQNVRFNFFESVGRSFVYTFKTAGAIFRVLGELLSGNLSLTTMGGPVTTIKVTGEMAVQGFQSFLQVAAYIGVNLAVFNLLPIPALDGSKAVFCLIEWVCKKPVPRKLEAVIHAIGFLLILAFAIVVDILQFAT